MAARVTARPSSLAFDLLCGCALAVGLGQLQLAWAIFEHHSAVALDANLLIGIGLIALLHAALGAGVVLAAHLGFSLARRLYQLVWGGTAAVAQRRRATQASSRPTSSWAALARRTGWTVRTASLAILFVSAGALALLLVRAPSLGPGDLVAEGFASTAPPRRPNVLLIVADSLRRDVFDDPAWLAQPALRLAKLAPNIAALQAEALDYTGYQAVSSWTLPSMAGMLTGRYPGTLGAHHDLVPDEARTLAEVLRDAGYQTAGVSDNFLTSGHYGFDQGHDFYWQKNNCILFSELWFAERVFPSFYQWMVRWLRFQYRGATEVNAQVRRWYERRDPGRPFYAMIHYMDTHYPYYVYDDLPDNVSNLSRPETFVPYYRLQLDARGRRLPPNADLTLDAEKIEDLRHRYLGSLQVVDQHVGEVFELLKSSGEWDRTLVVFTADHGEEFYEHSFIGHGRSLYQESTRVPLIVKWPRTGGETPGQTPNEAPDETPDEAADGIADETLVARRIDQPVGMLQLFPTILHVAGVEAGDLPLHPMLPTEPQPPFAVFAEFHRAGTQIYSGRLGPLKTLYSRRRNGREVFELYDLASDPDESRNLYDERPTPEPLRRDFDRFVAELRLLNESGQEVSDERLRELRSLGYVQ